MARSASVVTAVLFSLVMFVFVVVTAIYLVSTPFVVRTIAQVTQGDSEMPLEERLYAASMTASYVRNSGRSIDTIEYYRQDAASGPESIGHLLDVRDAFSVVRTVWALCAMSVIAVIALVVWRKWWNWLRLMIRVFAGLCIVVPVTFGLLAIFAFNPLFAFLHEVVFPQGNWQFPSSSLLIQVFPVEFWMLSMRLLVLLTLIISVSLVYLHKTLVARFLDVELKEDES